jgi:hypothetical protein
VDGRSGKKRKKMLQIFAVNDIVIMLGRTAEKHRACVVVITLPSDG